MADTLKQYCSKYITSSSTLLATAGSSGAVVRNIHLCNTAGTAVTVSISIGVSSAYSDTKALYKTFSIPAGGVHIANVNIVLNASETIYALAGTTNVVVATISGVDL